MEVLTSGKLGLSWSTKERDPWYTNDVQSGMGHFERGCLAVPAYSGRAVHDAGQVSRNLASDATYIKELLIYQMDFLSEKKRYELSATSSGIPVHAILPSSKTTMRVK